MLILHAHFAFLHLDRKSDPLHVVSGCKSKEAIPCSDTVKCHHLQTSRGFHGLL